MVIFEIAVALVFFMCAMPSGVLSVIWEKISENMMAPVPYIAILRIIIVAGIIIAAMLFEWTRRIQNGRDFCVVAASIEVLSLFGFSMSRVFWHLAIWTFFLGLGMGLGLMLLCLCMAGTGNRRANYLFALSAAGTYAGALILSKAMNSGKSWRTACQILAIAEAVLCLISFLTRSAVNGDMAEETGRIGRKRRIERARRREKLEESSGKVGEQQREAYLLRVYCLYASSAFLGLLIFSAVLWPGSYAVFNGGNVSVVNGISIVSAGLIAGRLMAGLLNLNSPKSCAIGCAILGIVFVISSVIMENGTASSSVLCLVQFFTGAGCGPIFPSMVIGNDARLDEDKESSLMSLVPAFYLGGLSIITPLTQALNGAQAQRHLALWMLIEASAMSVMLMFSFSRVRTE